MPLSETGNQVLRRYLEEIISAEKSVEAQLQEFCSAEADDSDVQNLFATHAAETHLQQERLGKRLESLGGPATRPKTPLASLFQSTLQLPHNVYVPEERSLRNLITSYTVETAEIAFYEALCNLARAAGDPDTETVARELQNENRIMAEKLWHLLPSRSKIAFNMLTVSEIDPAVETKMADDRVGS